MQYYLNRKKCNTTDKEITIVSNHKKSNFLKKMQITRYVFYHLFS